MPSGIQTLKKVISISFWVGGPNTHNEAPVDTQKGVQDDLNKQKALRAQCYLKGLREKS